MRIALIGYGKLGKAIESVALGCAHRISHCITSANAADLSLITSENTDVIIEATRPDAVIPHLLYASEQKIPLVTATTGWYDQLGEIQEHILKHNSALLYGSNFSIGVNILFKLNRMLASLMNRYPQYDVFLDERHHRFKNDAPGGTASKLAHEIIHHLDRKTVVVTGSELAERPPQTDELCLSVIRAGEIIGEHRVTYTSPVDRIEIAHQAFGREGFALGAVIAAEWLVGKTGVFEFSEVLG